MSTNTANTSSTSLSRKNKINPSQYQPIPDSTNKIEHGASVPRTSPPGSMIGNSGGYQSFTDIGDPNSNPHLFIHVAHGGKIVRPWQAYIVDLDDFFERIYQYWTRSGYVCIVVEQSLELIEIFLVTFFTFFFLHGIDYGVLFKNRSPDRLNSTVDSQTSTSSSSSLQQPPLKITIADCLVPLSEANVTPLEVIMLCCVTLFWIFKLIQTILAVVDNRAIHAFYAEVLQINDPSAYSWQEVQNQLIRNQSACMIREGYLDELAIHNRLLRRTNYMIALINKGVLPIYYRIPLLGETIYLTKGLEFNFDLLLFRGVFSLFENNWKLREEIKSPAERLMVAEQFAKRCLVLGIVNILLLPFIFIWQALYAFYTYVEAIKRDPGLASTRTWSRYGRWFCRHFNELEHELDQRLNRAHRPATRYMNSFTTPLLTIVARFFSFVPGILLSVLIVLTIYDEDVITVEHLITIMTTLGLVVAIARAFMPDNEPTRWTAAELDAAVLQHIHYRPHGYPAHIAQARAAMANVFVYKITPIIEELLSPLVTPYILCRHLRARSLDVVDFFRAYTIDLADIGDVCAFSLFNFQRNGLQMFNGGGGSKRSSQQQQQPTTTDAIVQDIGRQTTRNGKLELSLINFKLMNPSWQPTGTDQMAFIDRFTRQSKMPDATGGTTHAAITTSTGNGDGELSPHQHYSLDDQLPPLGDIPLLPLALMSPTQQTAAATAAATLGNSQSTVDFNQLQQATASMMVRPLNDEQFNTDIDADVGGGGGGMNRPIHQQQTTATTQSQSGSQMMKKLSSTSLQAATSFSSLTSAPIHHSMVASSSSRMPAPLPSSQQPTRLMSSSSSSLTGSRMMTMSTSASDRYNQRQRQRQQQQQNISGEMDNFGFGQTRRRLLQQLRMQQSTFSEQEERDTDMALSSLYFHQILTDSSDGLIGAGGGGGGDYTAAASGGNVDGNILDSSMLFEPILGATTAAEQRRTTTTVATMGTGTIGTGNNGGGGGVVVTMGGNSTQSESIPLLHAATPTHTDDRR